MRIQLDPDQDYQLDAVNAVADLFEGQTTGGGLDNSTWLTAMTGLEFTDLALGNTLHLTSEAIADNLKRIQARNGVDASATGEPIFTVEMETGTGKTYVYLRTIFELHERYGWKKFIIVVPSVAIREGVLKSIELMREHFKDLYGNVPFDTWMYDSAQASRLRSFATSNALQILILNIQAFDKKDINVIHQESDRMSGYRPLEFIQSSRPILILDEPQNMVSEKRKDAIASLNPLFEVRYSATHKEIVNLVYRLDPVQAYDLGLVKRIEVSSVLEEPDFNRPYIRLKRITEKPITAVLEMDVEAKTGPARRDVRIKQAGTDLFEVSGHREQYRDWIVAEIDLGNERIQFSNGVVLRKGEATGAEQDAVMRAQVRETIKRHFEKERAVSKLPESERMKVLSLFFIDRVANYAPEDGKIRKWFIEEYESVSTQYRELQPLPVDVVHGGYFSQDKSGPKDTRGNSKADDETYELIMRDKERLLSLAEPLRYIFSHSALREGWDNPNVFQICTLNETRSELKKRQEIGRGLRLPVRSNGTRCFENNLNILTVVANEHYDDFAKALQQELKEDCGVDFEDRVKNARSKRTVQLKKGWSADPYFLELWERIRTRTRYNVRFDTHELIRRAAEEIAEQCKVTKPQLVVKRAGIAITTEDGVQTHETSVAAAQRRVDEKPGIQDMLSYLQGTTGLTRHSLAQILISSGKLADASTNPQQFLTQAADCIKRVLTEFLVKGIEYMVIAGCSYEQRIFEDPEIIAYTERLLKVEKSIYEDIEWESQTEREFAEALDKREDIKLFIKLPRSFIVETPLGTYNPDWAIVWADDARLYLIRETKASLRPESLRPGEAGRINCGRKHFEAMNVDFAVVASSEEIP